MVLSLLGGGVVDETLSKIKIELKTKLDEVSF